jgi:SsrA-binding protein
MGKPKQPHTGTPVISNRKAYYNYSIGEELEAGIVLCGCEVKMVRQGSFSLQEAYCDFRDGELWLVGSHIPEYPQASTHVSLDPLRRRKLLLKRQELKRLRRKIIEKGTTIVPLKAYFVRGKVKVLIGLATGKRQYDKREAIKQRDLKREQSRIRK